jgi:hypothetical protein
VAPFGALPLQVLPEFELLLLHAAQTNARKQPRTKVRRIMFASSPPERQRALALLANVQKPARDPR